MRKNKLYRIIIQFICILCTFFLCLTNVLSTNEIDSFTITLKKGWNLISIPLIPEDNDYRLLSLFPDSNVAYEFINGAYVSVNTLKPGVGYWVQVDSDYTYTILGTLLSKCLQGPQGLKGDKGDTGPQGIKGEKGDKGDTGPQGEKGNKGDAGPQGIKGEKGDKGEAGISPFEINNNNISLIKGKIGIGTNNPTADLDIKSNFNKKLTGYIGIPKNSSNVTGVGTKFLEELTKGDSILIDNKEYTVTEIISNIYLILNSPHPEGVTDETIYTHGALLNIQDSNGESQLSLDKNGNLDVTGRIFGIQWRDYRSFIRFIKEDEITNEQLCPEGGVPTISTSPEQSLRLQTGNEICENSYHAEKTCVNVHALAPCATINHNHLPYSARACDENFQGQWAPFHWHTDKSTHEVTTHMLGNGIACYNVKYACCKE